MLVSCEKCSASYNIADEKIKSTGTVVRCPKCQAVFKVFPANAGQSSVACTNCGKPTAAVEGMAVVFCEACRNQLASGGGDEDLFKGADLFGGAASGGDSSGDAPPSEPTAAGGADLFSGDAPAGAAGDGLFADEPPPKGPDLFDDQPAPPAGSGGALFDDEPAPAADSGGGLFDDEPAPSADSGGGLFDDEPAPAADSGGGLFDDEPAPAADSGGGLFDDEPAPAPTASAGNLFEDEPAGDGGLFDEPAGGGQEADPFADFDAPAGASQGAAPNAAHDPFAELDAAGDTAGDDPFADFSSAPSDDMGFQEAELDGGADPYGDVEPDGPSPAPVRAKETPTFKKKESTGKDKVVDFLTENGVKIGLIGGGAAMVAVLALTAALAFMPEAFDARPTRPDAPKPGLFSRLSFGLQEVLKSPYYGQTMEQSYIDAGRRAMSAWSGTGFTAAEGEFQLLLRFDPNNQAAKAALAELYANWDLIEESTAHHAAIQANMASPQLSPAARTRSLIVLAKYDEAAAAAQGLGEQAPFYAALVSQMAGAVTATQDLIIHAQAHKGDFVVELLTARALRDAGMYAEAASFYTVASQSVGVNGKASLEIGKLYFGPLADHDKAFEAFNAVLAPAAGSSNGLKAEAQFHLSHILHRRGRGPEAVNAIQAALGMAPNDAKYLTKLGDLHFDQSKVVDAYQAYDKARTADPKFVAAYVGLGRANERLEKKTEAKQNYQQAIAIDPVNMPANVHYAELILSEGNPAEAERVLRAVIERDPMNDAALGHLAKFYWEQGRPGDALVEYGRIVEIAPDKLDGYVGKGAVLLEQGRVTEAKGMFLQASTIDGTNPSVMFRLGQAAYLEGDYVTAAESLRAALQRDPYHWEAHLYLGMALAKQANYTEALSEFQTTVGINQKAAEAYRQRALVYMIQSNHEGAPSDRRQAAVREFEQALYHRPNDPEYYYDYGIALEASGMGGKAKEAWLKALELRPGYQDAMFRLAAFYVAFTDYDAAEDILKKVLKGSPRNPQAYLGMGKVYLAKGNIEEAQRAFAKAAQLDPNSADAQTALGEVYDRQGLYQESTYYFKRALRINPNHGPALFNMALYWKDRDPARAKLSFKAAIKSATLSAEKAEEAKTLLRDLEYMK